VHHSLNQSAASPHHTPSAAAIWAPLRPFISGEARLGRFMAQRRWTAWLYEFARFGVKQGWACLFSGIAVLLMIGSWRFYPADAPLARYDFLFLSMIAVQVALLSGRLETWEEAKVILIYHLVGTTMENFKTSDGSWIYPEPNFSGCRKTSGPLPKPGSIRRSGMAGRWSRSTSSARGFCR
jgi:hypothetical protein